MATTTNSPIIPKRIILFIDVVSYFAGKDTKKAESVKTFGLNSI
jgi:hypothetical protein